jgi:hypothetical protein
LDEQGLEPRGSLCEAWWSGAYRRFHRCEGTDRPRRPGVRRSGSASYRRRSRRR